MSLMLSSVRDADEAGIALELGSDWIDVKEPRRGALGAPDRGKLRAVVERVAGRVPVSATIGDCWDRIREIVPRAAAARACGVDYVKVGLESRGTTRAGLDAVRECVAGGARLVVVCIAERPPGPAFLESLLTCGVDGVMLDTVDKAGPRLTELLSPDALTEFTQQVRGLGLLAGLAGRLTIEDIPGVDACGADYLGFRGALCIAGAREERIDPVTFERVRSAVTAAARARRTQHSEVA